MKILVTGGGGFVGRHLLRQLIADDTNEITATALEPLPHLPSDVPLSRVDWVTMDLTSSESIERAVQRSRPDRIYHLAGQASVGRSFGAPLDTWEANATGTVRLLHVLGQQDQECRLLLVSSAEVYGDSASAQNPVDEAAPIHPLNPYGASKAAAEVAALSAGAVGPIEVVVARSFNHIGPGQDARFVFPSVALQLARIEKGLAEPVVRVGNVDVERDFLDVRDVVAAYATLMERAVRSTVYNVASGTSYSLRALIERLIALSGIGARLEVDSSRLRPTDVPRLSGDAARLRSLGWSPAYSLDDALTGLLQDARASG